MSISIKNLITPSILIILTISAFFIRLENVKNTKLRSIDEIVYYRMGQQIVEEGLSGYNTIPYGNEMAAAGRDLPKYFFQPLFKHPPVFTLLVALSMKIFGVNIISASYVSLLLSVLMIPLIYLLGKLVFNHVIGLLSAAFLWLDPVSIICSQKVWMDSCLAFFITLSLFFFSYAIKKHNNYFFIFSGIACGLAVLTKYPGLLPLICIITHASLYNRKIFRNPYFIISQCIPFIMLTPWFYWNYIIYGLNSLANHNELQSLLNRIFHGPFPFIAILAIILCIISYFYRKKINTHAIVDINSFEETTPSNIMKIFSFLIVATLFGGLLKEQLVHSLQITYIPITTWVKDTFATEPPTFYFGRLIEFSPLYIFSFIFIFLYHANENKENSFLRLSASIILLFFIFWGNFQSRYILASIPLLIILGTQFGIKIYDQISKSENNLIYFAGRLGLKIFLIYIISKTYYINLALSYGNDMCYF